MPLYTYRCSECGPQDEQEFAIGTARRLASCVCGQTMRLVIGHGVHVAPSLHNPNVRHVDQTEARWDKDMPAYSRMRNRGMQPPQVDGSAALEDHCGDQLDIDYGNLYDEGVTRERVIEGTEQAADIMANGIAL